MRTSKCRIGSQSVHRGEAYLAYLAFLAQKNEFTPDPARLAAGRSPPTPKKTEFYADL